MAASAAVAYEVRWRAQGHDEAWSSPQSVAPANQIVVQDLEPGDYDFQVRAVSSCGAKSAWVDGTQTVREKNQRIGQGNLSMLTTGGIRSAWTGFTITYTATPTSATINCTAGTLQDGVSNPTYAASSATVSGTGGTTTTYYLYYDDAPGAGGTLALGTTTTYSDLSANQGRVFVGQVDVAFPSSGSSGGGGFPGGGGGRPPSNPI